MAKFFASTTPEISEREKHNMERARKIASQGMVLLSTTAPCPLKRRETSPSSATAAG
ncbi:MAG: hypothetical protein HFH85_10135 [Lachnospiraceae bacterium]|jgi:hypothetical protein|nr:hypothetical protein [Lachnospiraceae bacterium]